MDLESVTEELYGLPPQDFTAARGRHVAAARTAGDRALARQIQTLRRPTLSAWASNLLVRARPDEVTSLLALARRLETAEQREETARAAAHRAQTQAEAAARAADHARRRAGEAAARAERSA
ncbi:hypothetical protein [Streptomyces syringium]|uniref:hypothetical protein n=1 Tax=Streptomyces syringium TaxID=76729 RepID=UPI003452DD1B